MAGIRMGFAIGRPDLLKKISMHGGFNALPVTALAAAKSSLLQTDLIATRKATIGGIRTDTFAWLKGNGYSYTPSESNCFMLETKRPGKEVLAAMAAKDIYIGRIWPAWPTQVRITVGTGPEMLAFREAFHEVMNSNTAGLEPAPLPSRLEGRAFTHMS
jgi:histidinol-phosphate aminotransferase